MYIQVLTTKPILERKKTISFMPMLLQDTNDSRHVSAPPLSLAAYETKDKNKLYLSDSKLNISRSRFTKRRTGDVKKIRIFLNAKCFRLRWEHARRKHVITNIIMATIGLWLHMEYRMQRFRNEVHINLCYRSIIEAVFIET